MPIYEYDCRQCGQPFEELVFHVGRERVTVCPSCGSQDVKKKLSTVAARVAGGTGPAGTAGCSTGSP